MAIADKLVLQRQRHLKWPALDKLELALMILCGVLCFGFSLSVTCDIVTREIGRPWLWLQEVTSTLFIYAIFIGASVATRRNDPDLQVANRQTWTVTGIGQDGSLLLHSQGRDRKVPPEYASRFVELAYATTVHGAQGATVDAAHVLIGDTSGAASAYVAMTRGRKRNTAHLVAEDLDDARRQWVEVFGRDRADLGPAHARRQAIDAIDHYGTDGRRRPAPAPPPRPSPSRLPARIESPGL